jgi:hypothetical protein
MKFSRFLVFVCLISACSANDESTPSTNNASNNTSNNSTTNASNNASNNATNGSNNLTNNATNNTTQPCDTCAAAEVCFEDACCAPQTECAADQCGMVTDGCGLTIDCGICGCFNDNFTEFCPTRPCEVATSCNIDRECVYEAVTCGGSACECAGATCTDTEVRDCRDPNALICPADFCDPSPTMVNGAVVYQNSCVQPDGAVCTATNTCAEAACSGATCAESPCGLCNLGAWECAPNTTDSTCYDIPASALDIAQTDCDDTAATSTFIYLDHITGTDDMTSGSRSAPFLTFDAAMVAAKARGAKGVVVRSGLILTTTVQVENGISIYGGYSGTPDWKYDGGVLDIDVSTADANGNMVALAAHDITERTVLYRVNIRAGSATAPKSSSYGVHAVRAAGLVLQNVNVVAGNGSIGIAGADGAKGADGGDGGAGARYRVPGGPGANAACPLANGGGGGYGDPTGTGSGLNGGASAQGMSGGLGGAVGMRGEIGGTSLILPADGMNGAGGLHIIAVVDDFYVIPDGLDGTDGAAGFGGGGGGGTGGYSGGTGAGGGGGAAGGCGGTAGQGGTAAGGSFGLFVIDSTGLQILSSTIESTNGGPGGNGGNGGAHGVAGYRGVGAGITANLRAGNGGEGTVGGQGGHGGGGSGGDSYAIFCDGSQISTLNTDNCDADATCTNTAGSLSCACNAGYSGNGPFDSTLTVTLTFGFRAGAPGYSSGNNGGVGGLGYTYNCQ